MASNGQELGHCAWDITVLSAPVSSKPVNFLPSISNCKVGRVCMSETQHAKGPECPNPPCLSLLRMGLSVGTLGIKISWANLAPGGMIIVPLADSAMTSISAGVSSSITPGSTLIPCIVALLLPRIRPKVFLGKGPLTPVFIRWGPRSGVNTSPEVAQRSSPALPGVALRRVEMSVFLAVGEGLWKESALFQRLQVSAGLRTPEVGGPGAGP